MAKSPGGDKISRYIVMGVVAVVVAVGIIFSFLGNKSSPGALAPANVSLKDGYGVVFNGDLKGKPVVDLWEDFQCPVCARFEGINGRYMEQLIMEKRAKVVFHLLSFIGPESRLAANAGACAADENKFLQFHTYLYSHQYPENSGAWSNSGLIAAGAAAGVKSAKFVNCVNGATYNNWVTNIANDGAQKNVNSTPTVFVNGQEINRQTQYGTQPAFQEAVEGIK